MHRADLLDVMNGHLRNSCLREWRVRRESGCRPYTAWSTLSRGPSCDKAWFRRRRHERGIKAVSRHPLGSAQSSLEPRCPQGAEPAAGQWATQLMRSEEAVGRNSGKRGQTSRPPERRFPKLEKVVMDTDCLNPQDLAPEFSEHPLVLGLRSHERAGQLGAPACDASETRQHQQPVQP